MNWLQELCTSDEYCIKCKQSYKGGSFHACPKERPRIKRTSAKSAGGVITLKVIDAATWTEVVPSKEPARPYVDETAEALRKEVRKLQNQGMSDKDIFDALKKFDDDLPYPGLCLSEEELRALIPRMLGPDETFDTYDGIHLEFIRFDNATGKNVFRRPKKLSKTAQRKQRKKAADTFAAEEFGVKL